MMTTQPASTLDQWSKAVATRNRSPWPGPRPYDDDDPVSLLVGRPADSSRFRNLVQQHQLVVLDGESGVGKSSLLGKALVPELEASSFIVALVNDWSDDRETETVELLARLVHSALRRRSHLTESQLTALDSETGIDYFVALDEVYGRNCVLVFDQFEELIRHSSARAESVIDIVLDMNHALDLRIVVSLRSEFVHKLRRLEANAGPYTMASYSLKPISPADAIALVAAPNDLPEQEFPAIDATATDLVEQVWFAATVDRESSAPRPDAPGVLMLQGLLFVLEARARDSAGLEFEGATVTEAVVRSFLDDCFDELAAEHPEGGWTRGADPSTMSAEWAEGVLLHALSEAVDVKLRRCEVVARSIGLDHYLIEGARLYAGRCAPQLSSAGYKLLREADELANSVLGAELDTLRNGLAKVDQSIHGYFDQVKRDLLSSVLGPLVGRHGAEGAAIGGVGPAVVDLVSAHLSELMSAVESRERHSADAAEATSAELLATWLGAVDEHGDPDPLDSTCGPLLELSPAAALVEEHRRFAFALAWLKVSQIVRLTSPTPGQTVVALVHDRFGSGVKRWAQSVGGQPRDTFAAITSPKGLSLYWMGLSDDDRALVCSDAAHVRVVPNLRWRGAWVKGEFRNIVFVNCDLRGTMFHESKFEGVAFVNCLLDGGMFSDCEFIGPVPQAASDAGATAAPAWDDQDGRFRLVPSELDSHLAASWSRYRSCHDLGDTESTLVSPGAGASAELESAGHGSNLLDLWTGGPGGVLIYGGRISTFVVRTPEFWARPADGGDPVVHPDPSDAGLALRYVAGSGLDLVELDSGVAIELTGSAIRNLTLTGATIQKDERPPRVRVVSDGCALAQLWLGAGMSGVLTLRDSRALQIWSESEHVAIEADDASVVYGLVRWSGSEAAVEADGLDALKELSSRSDIRERTKRMDYIREPSTGRERGRNR